MFCSQLPRPLARGLSTCWDVVTPRSVLAPVGSHVMRSIHGVGELMTQVVLRGGGFLPAAPLAAAPEGSVKQAEPEKEDIMVMDTKLKIIEILQVTISRGAGRGTGTERSHGLH